MLLFLSPRQTRVIGRVTFVRKCRWYHPYGGSRRARLVERASERASMRARRAMGVAIGAFARRRRTRRAGLAKGTLPAGGHRSSSIFCPLPPSSFLARRLFLRLCSLLLNLSAPCVGL
ncbi:hypothetical protein IE81DRAFT_19082 [Ceraceosorus guamensis]|uniref:Uncharacterized protein n=1 Tax=Ceraceosorus guamensis TaxID=1522189 RepID=A0A316W3C7_9BASI|nr:hypothetical protein IE81DRAFT_19082 [Ceraceosorus guamensis]PWN44397.1 hypothetical protein IE81DRAFT_19082 [Ceraceosorus guamensis]